MTETRPLAGNRIWLTGLLFFLKRGKAGKVESWKVGEMRDGKLESWKIGKMEGWKIGKLENWIDLCLVSHGSQGMMILLAN